MVSLWTSRYPNWPPIHLYLLDIRAAGYTTSRWHTDDELTISDLPRVLIQVSDIANSWLVPVFGMVVLRSVHILDSEQCRYPMDYRWK
jgi:hypothetical protein